MKEQATEKFKALWVCIGLSLLIHVVVLLALFSPAIVSLFNADKTTTVKKKPKKKEMLVALIMPEPPKVYKQPELKPKQPKKPKSNKPKTKPPVSIAKAKVPPPNAEKPAVPLIGVKKKVPSYARTSDDQLQGVPKEADLQGERDTIASSNKEADATAPERAAIKGEDSSFDEATNTSYQDGDLAHMNKGGDAKKPPASLNDSNKSNPSDLDIINPTPPEPEQKKTADLANKEQEEKKSSIVESKERGEFLEKKDKKAAKSETVLNEKVKKYLETSNKQIAVAQELPEQEKKRAKKDQDLLDEQEEKNTIANKKADALAAKQKALESKRKKRTTPLKQASPDASKKGFRSEAKATVFEGSISRRSKAGSRNVKSSPMGKYMATVSKLVEKEWQRRCSMKADLIQPGTLRMSFMIDAKGKVLRPNKLMQTYGSELNYFITFQAIKSVKIPPMPAKVRSIQNGEPIEFIYTFAF